MLSVTPGTFIMEKQISEKVFRPGAGTDGVLRPPIWVFPHQVGKALLLLSEWSLRPLRQVKLLHGQTSQFGVLLWHV